MTNTKQIYIIVYGEKAKHDSINGCITGPIVSTTEDSAYRVVFNYVKKNIATMYEHEYTSSLKQLNITLPNLSDNEFEEENSFYQRLCKLTLPDIKKTIDWYFDLVDDENTDAFYRIRVVSV